MRRFFLALGIGVQVVARPLPHIIQPIQGPAQRVRGDPARRGALQDFLEQRHGPVPVWVAEVLGGNSDEGFQHPLLVFVEQQVPSSTSLVLQGRRVMVLRVSRDPVVDTLPGDSEHAGNVGGGATVVELEDGKSTPKQTGIPCLRELTPKAPPLR
jgi:hypothetical protein